MKKIKGALTTTERQVQKNRKTIAILILILVVSVAVNVIYITGLNEKIFKYKFVKVEEVSEMSEEETIADEVSDNNTEATGEIVEKSENDSNEEHQDNGMDISKEDSQPELKAVDDVEEVSEVDYFESLYNSSDVDLIEAVKENYNNAPIAKNAFKDSYEIGIYGDGVNYNFRKSYDYVVFSANGKNCRFNIEKLNEVREILRKESFKRYKFDTYEDSKGRIVDVPDLRRAVYEYSDDNYLYYPLEDMSEVLAYCEELEAIMLED